MEKNNVKNLKNHIGFLGVLPSKFSDIRNKAKTRIITAFFKFFMSKNYPGQVNYGSFWLISTLYLQLKILIKTIRRLSLLSRRIHSYNNISMKTFLKLTIKIYRKDTWFDKYLFY